MNKGQNFFVVITLFLLLVFLYVLINEVYSKNIIIFAVVLAISLFAISKVHKKNKECLALRNELKKCEDKLQFSQVELQNVLNFLDSGVAKIIFDGENQRHIQWANDGFYNLTGYGKAGYETGMNDNPHKVLHPDDMQWVFEAFNTHIKQRDSLSLEYRVIHKDGHVVWLYVKSNFVGVQDGSPVFISIMLDITAQKIMREEIILTQKRYEFINSISKELLFEYDLQSDLMKTFGSAVKYSVIDKEVRGFLANIHSLGFIHQDDRHVVTNMLSAATKDTTPVNSPKFRLKLTNDDYNWPDGPVQNFV